MRTSLLVLLVLLSTSTNALIADTLQWKVEDGGNGHWYELVAVNDPLLWPDAKVAAEGMYFLGVQGHLVTLTSAEENSFVYNNVYNRSVEAAWIGLTDDEAFGGHESFGQLNPQVDGWVWVTGEPVDFTSWQFISPNNAEGNEDYAHMNVYENFGFEPWDDGPSHATYPYIVEYDVLTVVPTPSTLVGLIGIALTGLLLNGRRRRTPVGDVSDTWGQSGR